MDEYNHDHDIFKSHEPMQSEIPKREDFPHAPFAEESLPPRHMYMSPPPVYVPPPPKKRSNFARFLAVTILAVAIGSGFLGIGLSAGYVAMQHFLPEAPEVEALPQTGFHSIALEPMRITIDPNIPDFTGVIATVKDAVVSINVTATIDRGRFIPPVEQPGAGSGFIFAQNEEYVFIATNNHVIANANTITISLDDNERVSARAIGADAESDLAVLAVAKAALLEKGVPFAVVELGCSDSMRMGDSVVAIGNAMGAGQTATKGIISAVNLQITVNDPNTRIPLTLDVLQTDAAVNHGNSGGPLINHNGEVIGIVTAKLFGHGIEGMGYVLPINDVSDLLIRLKEQGSERHAFIGLRTYAINEVIRYQFNLPAVGMLVGDVVIGGPAYNAGIIVRDLIVQFDGKIISSIDDYRAALFASRPGDEVVIGLYRGRTFMEITVLLGSITE